MHRSLLYKQNEIDNEIGGIPCSKVQCHREKNYEMMNTIVATVVSTPNRRSHNHKKCRKKNPEDPRHAGEITHRFAEKPKR